MTTPDTRLPGGADAKKPTPEITSRPWLSLQRAAWIAAAFCLLVSGYLLYQHARASERDPWKSPQLLALKEKLRAAPTDESVKTEIRRLDLEFRQRYKRRLALDATGGWLLVGGIAVLLLAAKPSVKLQTLPWLPKLRPDAANQAQQISKQARWSVAGVGAITGIGLLTLALLARSPLPDSAAELDRLLGKAGASESSASLPTLTEFQANWSRFRGMNGGARTNELSFDARSASVGPRASACRKTCMATRRRSQSGRAK